jgi:hypothetical protein
MEGTTPFSGSGQSPGSSGTFFFPFFLSFFFFFFFFFLFFFLRFLFLVHFDQRFDHFCTDHSQGLHGEEKILACLLAHGLKNTAIVFALEMFIPVPLSSQELVSKEHSLYLLMHFHRANKPERELD